MSKGNKKARKDQSAKQATGSRPEPKEFGPEEARKLHQAIGLEGSEFGLEQARKLLRFLRPEDGWTVEELEERLARELVEVHYLTEDNEKLIEMLRSRDWAINAMFGDFQSDRVHSADILDKLLSGALNLHNDTVQKIKKGLTLHRSLQGKRRANRRHSADGGYRQKRQAVREAWASGRYPSRDRCAEEVCGSLGISFSTARKALRNTPDPKKA